MDILKNLDYDIIKGSNEEYLPGGSSAIKKRLSGCYNHRQIKVCFEKAKKLIIASIRLKNTTIIATEKSN